MFAVSFQHSSKLLQTLWGRVNAWKSKVISCALINRDTPAALWPDWTEEEEEDVARLHFRVPGMKSWSAAARWAKPCNTGVQFSVTITKQELKLWVTGAGGRDDLTFTSEKSHWRRCYGRKLLTVTATFSSNFKVGIPDGRTEGWLNLNVFVTFVFEFEGEIQ